MIISEQITINDRQFTKTYSDSGFMVERDGAQYNEAIDPAEFGRTYTETDIPIDIEPLFNKNKLIITDTYENSNVQPYPNWNGNNIEYKVGDKVIYDNEIYEILQSHTSQPDWKPNNTIGLFRKII